MPGDEEKFDTDAVTAHLDRGWDLVQRGDFARAEQSARAVLELDGESPEAHTLLGAIAAGRGDPDEAIELYAKASELDPEFVDPLLYAAEAHLAAYDDEGDAARIDQALALCERALDVADEEDEYLDALLLKAEALVHKGGKRAEREARATLDELPDADLPDANYDLRAGRLALDLGDLDRADHHFERAARAAPDLTDALHGRALVAEARGDFPRMVEWNRRVRDADLAAPPPPWGIARERFEQIAEEALAALPPRVRELLANVPILVADYPSIELVAEGSDPRMLGFFSGVPWPEKSALDPASAHLDCVFLYQRNIERFARTREEVEEEIEKTLLHEAGHFFGLSEEDLDAMGLG